MVQLEKLISGPVLSLVGALSAAIAGGTGLASGLGLAPFWTDITVATVLFLVSIYWLALSLHPEKTARRIGFDTQDTGIHGNGRLSTQTISFALVTVALFLTSMWF